MNELARDLGGEFPIRSPDAVKMLILHRDAGREETLGAIRGELFVTFRIPAQLGQAHKDWVFCIMRTG